jgi:hypothetical protein
MVSMSLLTIALTAILGTSVFLIKSSFSLGSLTVMTSESRQCIDWLGRDLISTVDLTKAGKTEITVTVEDPDGKQEAITYQFDAANHYVTRQVGAGAKRILVRNVESMNFTCFDSKDSATTNLIDIKKIEVLMKLRDYVGTQKKKLEYQSARFVLRNRATS